MKRTAAQIAARVLAAFDRGLSYDGKPVDRAWLLETLERAADISEAPFDELVRDGFQDVEPDLGEAAIEHLVLMREEIRVALLRRLTS